MMETLSKRLDVYTTITPTVALAEIIAQILVGLLSILALATKSIKQGRYSEVFVAVEVFPELNATQKNLL
jgi:hypothetical protein